MATSTTPRKSLAQTIGSEGKKILKETHKGTSIAVFTSGGDSQGMNAAVRAVVRMGIFVGCKVYLIKEGYQGMVDGAENIVLADWKSVSGIIHLGGTVIGSARCMEFKEREGRLKAVANLIDKEICNLVCIGGDGSLTGANVFRQEWADLVAQLVKEERVCAEKASRCGRLNIVGIVGSIDNDFCGTDMTVGTDSALYRIIEAVDNIVSTAFSHKRCFIMEVMGRHCGYLALVAALAAEADYVFVPEWPPEDNWEDEMCNKLLSAKKRGQRVSIIIVSEGAIDRAGQPITANQIKDVITSKTELDTRVSVLGHIQRGGSPSAYDRILGSRMGAEAVLALMDATSESAPCVVAVDGNQIVRIPLMEAVQRTKDCAAAIEAKDYKEAVMLRGRGFKFNLETYLLFSRVEPTLGVSHPAENKVIAIFTIGSPACGMNAAMRAFVRMGVTHNFRVIGVHQGFQGLMNDDVEELKWDDVTGWSAMGGSMLRTSKMTADQAGLPKVAEHFRKYQIAGCLLIGGFEAYYSALVLAETRNKFPEFCIPMVVIPATVANNVPGTDFAIGSDTGLNEITNICDLMKQSAQGSTNRVFICESLGGYCGYLATLSALAGGADAAYIFEEPFSIHDLQADAQHLVAKMKHGVQRGLVLRAERAHDTFSCDFIHRVYAHEGRHMYTAKYNIIGEIQEGGRPSPFDRNMATRLGVRAAEKLMTQLLDCSTATGEVNTSLPESCTLLGLQKRAITFIPVQDLKKKTDFGHQISTEQWWLKLRPILRILATHESVYHNDSMHQMEVELPVAEEPPKINSMTGIPQLSTQPSLVQTASVAKQTPVAKQASVTKQPSAASAKQPSTTAAADAKQPSTTAVAAGAGSKNPSKTAVAAAGSKQGLAATGSTTGGLAGSGSVGAAAGGGSATKQPSASSKHSVKAG